MARYLQPEAAMGDLCDLPADRTHADDAQTTAGELMRQVRVVAPGEPAAGAQVSVHHAEAAQQREAGEDRMLGDRPRIDGRYVGNEHTGCGCRLDRDHVEAGAMADRRADAMLA